MTSTPARRSLILAGGGMRVAYQAGVLRALGEAGLAFDHADGTSGGTINLAMMLSGLSAAEMCDRWRTLDVRRFGAAMPLQSYLKAPHLMALGSASGITGHVFPHLGIDVAKIRNSSAIQGTFNVCNYTRKVSEVVPHQRIDLDLLVAGISLPIFMPPVAKDGSLYLDSVWIRDANLMEAVRRGAQEIWVVWCIGNTDVYNAGAFHQYVHMIELSANGSLFSDFERINEINARIATGEAVGGRTEPIRLHVVKPDFPLPLDPDFYTGRIDAATLIAMGYADAKAYLAAMSPAGLPFAPEVTRMRSPRLGVAFREVMAGGFTLGETDPAAGAAQAGRGGATLALHAAISIQDLAAFLADPGHLGQINGSVSFPPFGPDLPAKRGVFRLFSPTDDPKLKLMVYEMAFEHDGKDYYLAGRKEVRSRSFVHLWHDTTTLFTRLHLGADSSGPVVGAGILTLGPADLLRMAGTMHALNAGSVARGIAALAKFGWFFALELWNTYFRR